MDPSPAPSFDLRRWGGLCRSVLNGVVGDHLARGGNPLAIEMSLRVGGGRTRATPVSPGKLVVLLHGLTNRETIFQFPDRSRGDYGVRLQEDFGFTPYFLRYNTGLPIAENGRRFAELLEELVQGYPGPVDEVVLIGHSMGGLVARLAQRTASERELAWLSRLSHCVYLGTPHEGARLERFGRLAGKFLSSLPWAGGRRWAERIDARSAGIRDLAEGLSGDSPGTYWSGATHHFVSGSLTSNGDGLGAQLLGDGLVTRSSAAPESAPAGSHFADFGGISHFSLPCSEAVYRKIASWVGGAPAARAAAPSSQLEAPGSGGVRAPRELLAGAMDLAGQGVEVVADAAREVHMSIAELPHRVLDRVPVVREVSGGVEAAHRGIARFTYGLVRRGGSLLRAAGALVGEA